GPAIVTTDLRLNEPRYASLPNIMKAKKKPIDEKTPDAYGVDIKPRLEVMKTAEPPSRKSGVKVGSPAELVGKLKDSTNKAVTAVKGLGGDVHVLVAGLGCKAVAAAAAKLDGVNKVLLADAANYEHGLAEPLAALIVSLAGAYDAITAPATTNGKNVMPRVAALLD